MSTLHPDVEIPFDNNPKKKPETVLFYNKTKAGVDVIDQMARKYSVRAASRRWPIHVFYNAIDLALINSWILFRDTVFVSRASVAKSSHNVWLKNLQGQLQETVLEKMQLHQEIP